MPFVADKPSTFIPDKKQSSFVPDSKQSSFVPDEGPSVLSTSKQFLIGAGNSAAFNAWELLDKKSFEAQESQYLPDRIARGAGTAVGSVVGIPGLAFKVGSKIALKGIAKVAPKLVANADKGSKVAKAMVEGAGGMGLLNTFDPSTPIQEKPIHILEGIVGGAVTGAALYALPKAIQAIANKNKNLSKSSKAILNEAVKPPSQFTATGQEINPNPRAELVPSMKRLIPNEAQKVLEELEKRQTEILAADRGIISAKTQVQLAKNINAKEILDKWQPGQIVNAESMFAARINLVDRILSLPKNPSSDIVEKLSQDFIKADAMASEVGRTLGSLNRTQSMAAEQIKFLFENFKNLSPQANEAAKKLFKNLESPTFWDKFIEFRTASLLTSPYTQIRNTLGNTVPRLLKPFEKGMAGLASKTESVITGKPQQVFAREGVADVVGVIHGIRPAMRNAVKTLMDDSFTSNERIQEAVRFQRAIPGLKGKIIRSPFRALSAMDEFFSTLGKNASIYSQATRQAILEKAKDIPARTAELIKNPTIEMIARAEKEALKDTFRQPLGPAAQAIQNAINEKNVFSRAIKLVVPFFRTPVNLFKWTAERAPVTSIFSNWKAIAKGTPEQRAEAIGKFAVGQLISAGMILQAVDGNLTGKLSNDKNKREALMRQGIQPYSIKMGDKYISYRSYEPLSSWLALVANAAETYKSDDKKDYGTAMTITTETVKMMKDQSFLQGISDLTQALDDPDRYGKQFVQNMATSVIPTGIGYLSRLYDPVLREPDSIPEAIKARLPYFSKSIPPKLDVWGRPIQKDGSLAQRVFLPSGVTTAKPDLVEQEIISLENFPHKITKKYKGIDLTVQERNEVTVAEGRLKKAYLDQIIELPEYKNASPQDQSKIIDRVYREVNEAVRKPYFDAKFLQRLRSMKTQEERIKLTEEFARRKLIKR